MSVYYWCIGQDDNIGDVVLRRRMLRTLRRLGPVHALVGDASDGFVEALDLTAGGEVVHRSKARWAARALAAATRSGFVLAYDPGEVQIGSQSAASHAALLPVQLLAKVRGGASVRAAVSLLGGESPWRAPVLASARLCDVNAWRVPPPIEGVRQRRVMPDWAFDERLDDLDDPPPEDAPRTTFLLSYRYNRPPLDEAALAAVRAVAAERSLDVVVFNQVRRDRDRSIELAERLGAHAEVWDDGTSHLERERAVRSLLRGAAAVASDRLHALIVGAVEGAVPIGLLTATDTKIGPHLRVAGIDGVSVDATGMSTEAVHRFLQDALEQRGAIRAAVAEAQRAVRVVDDELLALGRAG